MPSGSLTSQAAGPAVRVASGRFMIGLSGTFSGTGQFERLSPDGVTWRAVALNTSGQLSAFTAPTGLLEASFNGPGVYRWNCTAWVSGSLDWAIDE